MTTMTQKEIAVGDLLYHAVHGLCRVDRRLEEDHSGKKVTCFALVQKIPSKMRTRFVISADGMEASGFHPLASPKEANRILDYLKAGDVAAIPPGVPKAASSIEPQKQTWGLAQVILSISYDKFEGRDQRKRQALERSAKGLVGEFAFVFKSSVKEAAAMLQQSLKKNAKINPSVFVALENASAD